MKVFLIVVALICVVLGAWLTRTGGPAQRSAGFAALVVGLMFAASALWVALS